MIYRKKYFFCNFALNKSNKNMSKTIQSQIDKSNKLLEGLRKNAAEVSNHGVTAASLDEMEATLKELAAINDECDAIRADLSKKVKHMNQVLLAAKAAHAEAKKTLKGYYPQERWAEFGIPDKR